MGNKTKNKNDTQFREIPVESSAINVEARTVQLSFSSETPVSRWWGPEILGHDETNIDLSRFNDGLGTLLFNHSSNQVIGHVESASIDTVARKCTALVRFDDDPESDLIFQKVVSGTLRGVSVGYRVSVWEEVDSNAVSSNGRFTGPCSIAIRWQPMEISIVSVPADASVGVGRSADEENNEKRGELNMGEENKNKEVQEQNTVNEEAIRTAAADAETQRVLEITGMCRSFNVDPMDFIKDKVSAEGARKAIMDKLAQERTATPVASIGVGAEDREKFRSAAIDAIQMRAGQTVVKPADGASELRSMRLLDLARECVERSTGERARFSNDEDLIREALTGSSQFPGILSNVANKSMASSYDAVPTTFQLWTRKGSNTDFKAATRYRLSEADELLAMTENGEFKNAEISEASVTASIGTFGRTFSISRKAIINDDLGALSTIPAKYGAAARRMINRMVYKILSDNPTIENAALFHANHGNLAGTAAALSVASLGKAKAAMAKQKNIGGKEYLNIQPAYLLVPTELEVTAAQLISSVVDPTKSNATPNPFANKLSVVSDPLIDEISATNWFLAAAAGMADTIEVTYLNGREQPTMESQVSFDVLGIKWRIYLDFGVNLLDFRGMYKNAGA